MSMIVKTVARWLKGPILLFGIYIVLYGHITPGGGFGGGVIIACAFILITLALGEKNGLDVFSKDLASRLDSGGLLIFLVVGWLGLNIALGLKVASALFLVFTVLTALRIAQGGVDVEENPEEEGP